MTTHLNATVRTFPLTPVQRAYRVGRGDELPLGGVACHMYFEFDGCGLSIDARRLGTAVDRLRERHPMFRAAFPDCEEDDPVGVVLERALDTFVINDLSALSAERCETELQRLRRKMSGQRMPVHEGQVVEVQLTRLPGDRTRLHVDVDLLAADPPSIRVALDELAELYRSGGTNLVQPGDPFAGRDIDDAGEVPQSWRGRELVPPDPPMAQDPREVSGAHFVRRDVTVDPKAWHRIAERAAQEGVVEDTVLLAAFVHTLARWSTRPEFLVSLPVFDAEGATGRGQATVGDFSRVLTAGFAQRHETTLADLVRGVEAERGRTAPTVQAIQQAARRSGETPPLLGAVYTALDRPWVTDRFVECFGQVGWMLSQTPQVWLDCLAYPHAGGRRLSLDCPQGLLKPGVLESMAEHCEQLLAAFADQDWASPPPNGLPSHQQHARDRVNATDRTESGRLLHQRFFELASTDPHPDALIGEGRTLTRGELSEQALRLAALLRSRGAAPGDAVCVSLPAGVDQVIAVLAVLAAGCCYVPVSPEQPRQRLHTILETANVRLVVTAADVAAGDLPETCVPVTLDEAAAHDALEAPADVPGDSLAYIIFTSGSTGTPKGVEITHRSAVNSVEDINDRWQVGPQDRCMPVSALDFDLSVYEIFGPLMAGGSVVMPGPDQTRDPEAWLSLIERHQVTVWDSVPALLDALVSVAEAGTPPATLRLALTGGDWIPLDLPDRLRRLVPECAFVACGGATEGSIYSNYFEVGDVDPDWTSIPYGRPLGNQRYRVVDYIGRDCPDWVPGEMWIGGTGVAHGYREDPERTARQFPHVDGARWYRTGDMGRYWPDGTLEFLGRTDHQVKLRGYRIELGEVESALASFAQVARAVVLVVGEGGHRRLVAYIRPAGEAMDIDGLRAHLQQRLPDYAHPSDLLMIAEFPLSGNGKIDRKRLASWAVPEPETVPDEPPRDALERALAEDWTAVLGRPVTSRHADFSAAGGDSLRAMRLAAALKRRYHHGFPLRRLQAAATLADMADLVRATLPATPPKQREHS